MVADVRLTGWDDTATLGSDDAELEPGGGLLGATSEAASALAGLRCSARPCAGLPCPGSLLLRMVPSGSAEGSADWLRWLSEPGWDE